LETWIGFDFSTLAIIMFFCVGIYVSKLKDKIDNLENELENLKSDIRNSSKGFRHHLSSESVKSNSRMDETEI
jgi:hypothetical protein